MNDIENVELDRLEEMMRECIDVAMYKKTAGKPYSPCMEVCIEDARYLAGLLQELRDLRSGAIVEHLNAEIQKHTNMFNELHEDFEGAIDRIKDLLHQDDGQAYKEAERFLERFGYTIKAGGEG